MNNFENVGVVILAAGRGSRLNCVDVPKAILPLDGKPVISYILKELSENGVPKKNICLVVGYKAETVKEEFGNEYSYALQKELLGTAHAAYTGERALDNKIDTFLVLNGDDSAFYSFETLNDFVVNHLKNENDVSLLTCGVNDPTLGKVIRNKEGNVVAILEKEQTTEEHKDIHEINTNTFCFNRKWFSEHYPALKRIPGLGEFGLPSFVEEALRTNALFEATKLDNPKEWFGINTKEQLEEANRRKQSN